jgi:hypothetical protein
MRARHPKAFCLIAAPPLLAALLIVAALSACASSAAPTQTKTPSSSSQQRLQEITRYETEARAVVALFGSRLQNVSLQSPSAAGQLRTQLIGLVSPGLLADWAADPATAPGRQVSSPWPDHIEIKSLVFHDATACEVGGSLALISSDYVTSGRPDAQVPVRLGLTRVDDRWLITSYTEQSGTSSSSTSATIGWDVRQASRLLRHVFALVEQHHYAQARSLFIAPESVWALADARRVRTISLVSASEMASHTTLDTLTLWTVVRRSPPAIAGSPSWPNVVQFRFDASGRLRITAFASGP